MQENQVLTGEKATMDDVLKAYRDIMGAIMRKEKSMVSSTYCFDSSEALQQAIENIMKTGNMPEKGKEYAYLKQAIRQNMKMAYRHENIGNIFKGIGENGSENPNYAKLQEIECNQGYGLSDAYIREILTDIRKTLTIEEYWIFEHYSLKDWNYSEISQELGESIATIGRKVVKIFNKIQGLHLQAIYDVRYVNALHPKRRSYYAPHKEKDSEIKALGLKEYEDSKAPVSIRKPYKKGASLNTVFLKHENSNEKRNACNIKYIGEIFEGCKNKEYIQILSSQAQYRRMQTKGITARPDMAYTGPADCLKTYRIDGRLMVSDSPRVTLQIA